MDPLCRRCLPPLPPQRRDAAPDEMARPLMHARTILIIFLLVGAYSTYSSNWRLESYWGVGAYLEVGADSVPYSIKKLFFRVSKHLRIFPLYLKIFFFVEC